MTLEADERGKISMKSQIEDYCQRGKALEDTNIIDYFLNTYEIDIDNKGEVDSIAGTYNSKQRGCPRHQRVPYLQGHPKARMKQRIFCSGNHHTLPNFIGRYFPPWDDPDEYPFYCALMLMLLKPWR